jgi:hypothetical protein
LLGRCGVPQRARQTEPDAWSWAAVGVNSRRARGTAGSQGEAVAEAVAKLGPLLLIEIRDPAGSVTRLGKIVDGNELPTTS